MNVQLIVDSSYNIGEIWDSQLYFLSFHELPGGIHCLTFLPHGIITMVWEGVNHCMAQLILSA